MTETAPYTIHALELGSMGNFIYIIHDHATDRAAVVDPAWDVPSILSLTERHGLRITDILLTHSHFDHINGVEALLNASDAQLHLPRAEAAFWDRYTDLPTLQDGGDRIELGETKIEILHTPGHTPACLSYLIGDAVFVGDTLFMPDYGTARCDFPGGDSATLYQSVQKLLALPPGQR